ncbi:AAA family ATPase [Kutzneria sp. NPDC052558]|uniref:AAA family ATPase n=1 Tax=Kutzneria sp. NPDC052558 TaxID=3364121 RepID=UPI0037C9F878
MDKAGTPVLGRVLLGRTEELGHLERRAELAVQGRGQAVLLRGPSGIGKTQLLRAAEQRFAAQGMRVLRAGCTEVGSGSGYVAVRELFDGIDEDLLQGAARWARAALIPGDDGDQPAGGYAVLHGLYWLVVGLSGEQPLVLIVDDAHWADNSSLRWLDFLLRRADNLRLLVVIAQRTGLAGGELLAGLSTHECCSTLEVAPLGPDDVVDLIAAGLDEAPAPAFAARCGDVSGGNPLLLDRLLGELRRQGVQPDAQSVELVQELGRDVLTASVLTALSNQPEHVTAVARAAALIGTSPPHRLAALGQVPVRAVAPALSALSRCDVLDADHTGFVHDQVRTTILAGISAEELHATRARAARLLSDEGEPAEAVAGHLLLTPVDEPWMQSVLWDAAASAGRRGSAEAAMNYLQRALDSKWPDADTRTRMQIDLAGLMAQIDPAGALATLREVLGRITDPRARTPLAALFARAAQPVYSSHEAVDLLVEVIDQLDAVIGPEPGPADQELRTLAESALLMAATDECSTLPLATARARAMADPPGHSGSEMLALSLMAMLSAFEGGSVETVLRRARRVMDARDIPVDGMTLLGASLAFELAGDVDSALAGLERTLTETRRRAEPVMHVMALGFRAVMQRRRGELAEAAADAQTAADVAGQELPGLLLTLPLIAQAGVFADVGEPERAAELLGLVVRPRYEEFGWEWYNYALVQAKVLRQLGDLPGTLEMLRRCERSMAEAGITNPMYVLWWPEAVDVLVELGRRDEAAALAARMSEDVKRWPIPKAAGLVALVTGLVAEDPKDAVAPLTAAVERLEDCGAIPDRIRAGHRLGQALLRAGDVKQARQVLRAAMDVANRSGERVEVAAIGRLVVQAGGRVRNPSDSPVDALTGSERRVTAMAADGLSNRAIAETLFVSLRTVEVHLTSSYRKLGVSGRAELTAILRAER